MEPFLILSLANILQVEKETIGLIVRIYLLRIANLKHLQLVKGWRIFGMFLNERQIMKIEGAIVTVMYKGCKSSKGVEIELSWLKPLEQGAE